MALRRDSLAPASKKTAPVRILEIRESTRPIASNIRNAYIDFSKMTLSLVAVVTDQVRDGQPVIGCGFNSNGRYGQGALMRERFIPRVLGAAPDSLLDERGLLCPHRIWAAMMTNEKPGGHGERSVAVGTIDMAVWDAVAKIEGKPLFQLLADRYGDGRPNRRVFVYAAGGYYWPDKGLDGLTREMRSYLDRGYSVVKMKIGGSRSTPTGASTCPPRSTTRRRSRSTTSSGTRRRAIRSTTRCRPSSRTTTTSRWPPARTCSRCRTRATWSAMPACGPTATGCSSTAR
jgi:L-alanine-DL-glutamate epimerase-like enolase superfamily enzyme